MAALEDKDIPEFLDYLEDKIGKLGTNHPAEGEAGGVGSNLIQILTEDKERAAVVFVTRYPAEAKALYAIMDMALRYIDREDNRS
ncbi:MAG: hypothetical protein V3S25_11560 [Nitrospirales bacterium]